MFSFITLKKTQKTDISSCVQKYAKKALSPTRLSNLKKIMPIVEEKRNKVVANNKYINVDSINNLLEYYGFTRQIVNNLPVLDKDPIGIQCKWSDIYGSNSVATYNFAYEHASILFNIAAMRTQAGYQYIQDTKTMDSVQKAIDEYEEAANIFNFLQNKLYSSFSQVPKSWDMEVTCLTAFENYAHGMAQMAIIYKADLIGTKNIAKYSIWMGCKTLFEEAANHFNTRNALELYKRCVVLAYLSEVQAYFSLFHHYMDLSKQGSRATGICVGITNYINERLRNIHTHCSKGVPKELLPVITQLSTEGSTAFSAALNANRIFLEGEVKVDAIPNKPRASIVHPIKEPTLPSFQDEAFTNLVPQSVIDALDRYREYVEEQVNAGLQKIEAANAALTQCQQDLHVESALTAGSANHDIPDSLWNSISELQKSEAILGYEKKYSTIETMAKNVTSLFTQIMQENNQMEQTILQYYQQNPHVPQTLNPSYFTQYIQQTASTINGEQATKAKASLDQIMATIRKFAPLLTSSREEIAKQLPAVQLNADGVNALMNLRTANDAVNAILKERADTIQEIVNSAYDDVPLRDKLMTQRSLDERGLFIQAFLPVQDKLSKLELTIPAQEGALNALQEKYAIYNQLRLQDPSIKQSDQFFQDLQNAIKTIHNSNSLFDGATAFYTQLEQNIQKCRSDIQQHLKKFEEMQQSTPMNNQSFMPNPPMNNQSFMPNPPMNNQSFMQSPPMNNQSFMPSQFNQAPGKVCSVCTTINNPQSTFCISCGRHL